MTKNKSYCLINMVKGKLKYWSSTNLSLARRTLIVRQILMPSLWYYIVVRVGSMKLLGIKPLLRKYVWSGSENTARARVSWDDCTMPKKVGGLTIISPEDAMKALMSKWVIQALLLGKSNLQTILRHRIKQLQPPPMFSPHFLTKGGTKVWHHIIQSWKIDDGKNVRMPPPTIPEGILQLNLWWRTKCQGIYFGTIMSKAYTLYKPHERLIRLEGEASFHAQGVAHCKDHPSY